MVVETASGTVEQLRREQMTFHDALDQHPFFSSLRRGAVTKEQYVQFLAQTRHFVERSMPVLQKCGERLNRLNRHPELAALLFEKAGEEDRHEFLIDKDIKAIGGDPVAALATGPSNWVAAYNAWIEATSVSDHPAGFLGGAYVLEALSVHRASELHDQLLVSASIAGIERGVSFLRLHGAEDIGHVKELEDVLATVEDKAETDMILLTAAVTRQFYLGMMDQLEEAQASTK